MGLSDQRHAALIALSLTMALGAALSCTLNTTGVEANSLGPTSPSGASGASGASTEGAGGSAGAGSQGGGDTNSASVGGAGGTDGTGGAGGDGGSQPELKCGDGILTPPEACDDGNTSDGDACTSNCSCGTDDPNTEAHTRPEDGHCYVLVKTPMKGIDAGIDCYNKGTFLAAITSDSERIFVGSFIDGFAWLGGTDWGSEGKWKWANGELWSIAPCDGSPPLCDNSVKLWNGNEPNGGTNENCLQFVGNDDKFNDSNCDQKHPFLCEKAP